MRAVVTVHKRPLPLLGDEPTEGDVVALRVIASVRTIREKPSARGHPVAEIVFEGLEVSLEPTLACSCLAAPRPSPAERAVLVADLRSEGMSLRAIGSRISVSHTQVRKDLARGNGGNGFQRSA